MAETITPSVADYQIRTRLVADLGSKRRFIVNDDVGTHKLVSLSPYLVARSPRRTSGPPVSLVPWLPSSRRSSPARRTRKRQTNVTRPPRSSRASSKRFPQRSPRPRHTLQNRRRNRRRAARRRRRRKTVGSRFSGLGPAQCPLPRTRGKPRRMCPTSPSTSPCQRSSVPARSVSCSRRIRATRVRYPTTSSASGD